MAHKLPRLMFAAPASGGGKTTLTMAFLGALRARGLHPAAFKTGPDYIDPLFHREVLRVPGGNLDLFFTPPELVRGLLLRGASDAGVAVLEGVMGYYDGVGDSGEASSWRLAVETQTPAVLVVRPGGAFLSLAALARGFATFRDDSMVRGIVLNRCSETFYQKAAPMLERETGLRVYGYMPEVPEVVLESRHLGLITPDAVDALREKTALLAERAARCLDMDGLLELAASAKPIAAAPLVVDRAAEPPVRIAVARDAAFCFYYRENLELLEMLGAEPVFFSPLEDDSLPDAIGGLYLGGGYPELHASALSHNNAMRRAVKEAVGAGLPTIAECGGFLYLQEELQDGAGMVYPMAGALAGKGFNARKLVRFGYKVLQSVGDNLLCAEGDSIRAHEFHYWDSTRCGDGCVAVKADGSGRTACVEAGPSLFAGFPHLYFWSNPPCARRFVGAAAKWRGGKEAGSCMPSSPS